MYLYVLENENQKMAFFELAKHIANADNKLHDEEKKMLLAYKNEMGIECEISTKNKLTIDEALNVFKNSDDKIKNGIFIEALALTMADEIYHTNEINIINKMRNSFGITEQKESQCREWIVSINELYKKGENLLN